MMSSLDSPGRAGSRAGRLGKEGECVGVHGPNGCEMAMVEGGNSLFAVPFGQRDEPGVGAAQAQVGVSGDEVANALPVLDRERLDMQLAVEDRLVEQRLDARAEFTVEQVGESRR